MKLISRRIFVALGLFAGLLPLAQAAQQADSFPNRPVRIIVPFPPGGSNDTLSRFIGVKLGERLGQQIVIDNRAGANGIIGTEIASQSTNDGYNLLIVSTSYVMNAAVRKLPYDVVKSFDPISMIGSAPNCLVVNPQGPFSSIGALVEQAKANPGKFNYASTGVGGFNHFGGELFKKVTGTNMVHVPYKGGGPAMIDVIANNIPLMFSSVTQVLAHVRSNRLKVIAVGAEKRTPVLPDVPTVIESGFPGYDVSVWWGLSAPAGVPGPVMKKLSRELTVILKDPATQKRLLADAAQPQIMAPEEIRRMIRSDVKKWTGVAKQANIQVK
jgi:tripartite-type tricarboxylate transporter receptor subunit TctC